MVTLAYPRTGWAALRLELHATESDLATAIAYWMWRDRSALPAVTLMAPIANRIVGVSAAMDARRSARAA